VGGVELRLMETVAGDLRSRRERCERQDIGDDLALNVELD